MITGKNVVICSQTKMWSSAHRQKYCPLLTEKNVFICHTTQSVFYAWTLVPGTPGRKVQYFIPYCTTLFHAKPLPSIHQAASVLSIPACKTDQLTLLFCFAIFHCHVLDPNNCPSCLTSPLYLALKQFLPYLCAIKMRCCTPAPWDVKRAKSGVILARGQVQPVHARVQPNLEKSRWERRASF